MPVWPRGTVYSPHASFGHYSRVAMQSSLSLIPRYILHNSEYSSKVTLFRRILRTREEKSTICGFEGPAIISLSQNVGSSITAQGFCIIRFLSIRLILSLTLRTGLLNGSSGKICWKGSRNYCYLYQNRRAGFIKQFTRMGKRSRKPQDI